MVRRERLPFLFLHFALQTGAQGERASFCAKSALQKPARGWLLVGCAPAPALLAFPCSIACPAMGRTPCDRGCECRVGLVSGGMDGWIIDESLGKPPPPCFRCPSRPSLPLLGSETGRKNGGKRESRPAFGFALSRVSDFGCVTLLCFLAFIHN